VGIAAALYGNIEGGTGIPIASLAISSLDDFTTLSIPLSPMGVSYLNTFLAGPVILGGSVPSISVPSGTPQQPFGFTAPEIPGSGSSVPKLVVTLVPEPSSFVLAAFALVAVAIVIASRQKRAALFG
jgi:hypothetical protein